MGVLFIQLIMHLNKETPLQRGKYIIESVLGQGSFGITYLATTKFQGPLGDISVKVAIKEFFARDLNMRHPDGTVAEVSSGSLSGKYAKDFQREAKNLSSLKHPNIINVLEAFSENNTHYYVMEYIDGGNLDDYILSKGRLNESEALDIASQMASALSYMHSHNMLHLDLKPRNVMRRSDGSVCLIDFGLSKQYESSGEPESSTTIGLGTPGYAPLEQGSSDERKNFAPTLDIYALGASVFKMLTGNTPPRASDIMNDGFPSDELAALGISSATISTIERMMSPRKKDRPQSIRECELNAVCEYFDKTEVLFDETNIIEKKTIMIGNHNSNKNVFNRFIVDKWPYLLLFCIAVMGVVAIGLKKNSDQKEIEARELYRRQELKILEANKILAKMGVEYPMVHVSGGSFFMGSIDAIACEDEKPVHRVKLSDFWIGKYEVTLDLWQAIMGTNPNGYVITHDLSKRPVSNVSWDDCQKFISKLNHLTGLHFKLPTEAQWEYAARGGDRSNGYEYSGSNDINVVAWYGSDIQYEENYPHNVGTKSPNELCIYDMSGNVYEWCQDWQGSYSHKSISDPVGPSVGTHRIFRGGSAGRTMEYHRVSRRGYAHPDFRTGMLGLRLCL